MRRTVEGIGEVEELGGVANLGDPESVPEDELALNCLFPPPVLEVASGIVPIARGPGFPDNGREEGLTKAVKTVKQPLTFTPLLTILLRDGERRALMPDERCTGSGLHVGMQHFDGNVELGCHDVLLNRSHPLPL
eukprot:2088453-Heterocapsa_arctica.AAC.1